MDTAINEQKTNDWFLRGNTESMALVKGTLYPPYVSLPQNDRLRFALQVPYKADAFLCALETPSISQSDIKLDEQERGMILHYVAEELGRAYAREAFDTVSSGWRALLKDLLAAGTDLHSSGQHGPQHTPMSSFLSMCFLFNLSVTAAIQFWATELDIAGIDLLRYGRKEIRLQEALSLNNPSRMTYATSTPIWGYKWPFVSRQIALHSFTCGTLPSDWNVSVRRLVPLWLRRSSLAVPGAWPFEDPCILKAICWEPSADEDEAEGGFEFVRWIPLSSDIAEPDEEYVRWSMYDEQSEDDSIFEGTNGVLNPNDQAAERRNSIASSAPLAHETKRTSRASQKYRSLLARTRYAGLVDEFKRDSADISYALELNRSSGKEQF